jgi:glycosyltransferase involved in cell wall biosynthesis
VVSMGRRVSQKQHDVLVESLREILTKESDFPVLAVFATVHGDSNSPAILARIKALVAEFPSNVVCEDGQLAYYKELMAAADFNCMPSLYEPHGGAYEGTVIPIARAVDGLAEQICGRNPRGMAKLINDRWHTEGEQPTGFLFREDSTPSQSPAEQFESLLKGSPFSRVFQTMRDSLAAVLREAVDLRLKHDDEYARLVLAALRKQEGLSWQVNLDEMLALMEEARITRNVA